MMMKKACVYAVCDQFVAHVPLVEAKPRSAELVCRIFEYAEAHYREDISLQDVATHFGYEYHYLSRLLSQRLGIRFSDMVNEMRLSRALDLLQTNEHTVTQVAAASGFSSIRTFNYVFKKHMGQSPVAYMQRRLP